jgi:GLPGLI family protein
MKNISLAFFLLSATLLYSQKGAKITYEENSLNSIITSQLISNGELSIYKKIDFKGSEENPGESKKIIANLEKKAIYLAKIFSEGKILYPANHIFDSKKQIIYDSLNSIKWQMVKNATTTKYLGRNVKMAKCRFRERNYTALYCPDIPISDGPFKFNGLPGLILKISSDDHFISFNATKIEFFENLEVKIAPRYFTNQIQFWTYLKLAKKQMAADYKRYLSTLPPDQRNVKFELKIDRIEMVF